ncbi:MAG TPA: hypothetical protein DCQ64_01325 [Candidatus Rokubacteria bacterium]|nr:hypothetical protein [Candidatus Rokubacteria bacterium]
MAEGQTKKLAGKYGTPEELEAAYAALEAKLGEQGQQLGTLQQQLQQAAQALTEFGEWTKAAKPIVDWYSTNANDVKTWWEGRGQQGQGAQPGVRQQAQQLAQQQPGYEWLTPQEREGLIQESAKYLQANMLQPWTQQFGQQAQAFANQLQRNQQAFTNVLWKTLERAMPPEKLAEIKTWHEEALKWADPSKIDPMEAANNVLSLTSERDRLKTQVDEMTKARETADKAALGAINGDGFSGSINDTLPEPPKDRGDRFQRVMADVKQEHGAEGMRTLFGGGNLA